MKPPICDAFTVLIASPERSLWKTFHECEARRLFFPVFSRAEIGDMLRTCFRHRLTDPTSNFERLVRDRYKAWGGIPRYVLDRPDAELRLPFEPDLSRVDMEALVAQMVSADESEKDSAISHLRLHLKPVGEQPDGSFANPSEAASYSLDRTELATPSVKKWLARVVNKQGLAFLRDFVWVHPTSKTANKLYADLVKRVASVPGLSRA